MWGGSMRSQGFPQLFSFAKTVNISVRRAAEILDLNQFFQLPISTEAFQQLLVLAQDLADLSLEHDQDDVWTYSWGSTIYWPIKAYKVLLGSRQVHPCFSWLWKASAQKKHKVFFWLLLKDRLSTRNILRRKNKVLPSYDCVLCQLHLDETLEHLFLCCPFAISCWNLLHLVVTGSDPFQIIQSFKS
jgi:hypothetical protein